MTIELRSFVEPIEFRSGPTGTITATGVAMRYGAKSKLIGGRFRERFRPGSLAKTIKEQDIRSHLEHHGAYLGRSGAGTLRLTDSPTELSYELDLPDTTGGRDAAALLERGDLRGCSIGFRALPKVGDSWSVDADGVALRTVAEARLSLVDLTVAPAYTDSTAEVALRSLIESHHLDPAEVAAAAESGALGALIAEGPQDPEAEQSRETPTLLRPHLGWLSA